MNSMLEPNNYETSLKKTYRDILILGEELDGRITELTLELIQKANQLSGKNGIVYILFCTKNRERIEEEIKYYGADHVVFIEHPLFGNFEDEIMADEIIKTIITISPEIVLAGASQRGRALVPRIATSLHTGLTADCTGLEIDDVTGLLYQTRPAFGGNLIATIKTEICRPQMATVRLHVFPLPEKKLNLNQTIQVLKPNIHSNGYKKVLGSIKRVNESVNILDSHFIIAGGRGVGRKEGFDLLGKLATTVGGTVGATRAAVDMGWVPHHHQIGQTGYTVRPKVYVACGISGQIQHIAGMQNSSFIIAINKDKTAPIMEIADVAFVGDMYEIVPVLIKEFSDYRKSTH